MIDALLESAPSVRPACADDEPPHRRVQLTWAVVLAGGRGTRLAPLTDARAKPALPFGGNLRIVDFALGNCLNSGLRRISVLTQYRAQGLIRHLAAGYRDAAVGNGGFVDAVPAQQKTGEGWYAGTADAVHQNLDLLDEAETRYVLVLAGDHVYRMDFGRMIAEHAARGGGASVACVEVPREQASSFGVMRVGPDGRVLDFEEKPRRPAPVPGRDDLSLASMGIYLFDADLLASELRRDAADARSGHDFGRDLLPRLVERARVHAHRFPDSCVGPAGLPAYWRDVGTIDAYWDAHMDLLRTPPALDLDDDAWPIRGVPSCAPPARFAIDEPGRRGVATDSLVAAGCVVTGATVRRSVLSTRARASEGSLVEESVLLPRASVGRDVLLRRAIVDEDCHVPDGLRVGVDPALDRARFAVSERGVVVVTAAAVAALGARRGG